MTSNFLYGINLAALLLSRNAFVPQRETCSFFIDLFRSLQSSNFAAFRNRTEVVTSSHLCMCAFTSLRPVNVDRKYFLKKIHYSLLLFKLFV